MEHTPGPWEVLPSNIWNGPVIKNNSRYDINTNEEEQTSEVNANAQLISTAPELLEACKEALDAFGYVTHAGKRLDKVYNAENLLKAAIAKAEGR